VPRGPRSFEDRIGGIRHNALWKPTCLDRAQVEGLKTECAPFLGGNVDDAPPGPGRRADATAVLNDLNRSALPGHAIRRWNHIERFTRQARQALSLRRSCSQSHYNG